MRSWGARSVSVSLLVTNLTFTKAEKEMTMHRKRSPTGVAKITMDPERETVMLFVLMFVCAILLILIVCIVDRRARNNTAIRAQIHDVV